MSWRTITALLLALGLLAACAEEPIPSGPIVFTNDSSVQDDTRQGPTLKLLSFEWRHLDATDMLRVTGWAQNSGTEVVQTPRLMAEAFDQFNEPLGAAQAFLEPTYINPGQKAKFEFFLQRGRWVKALRLRYHFETRM